MITGTNKTAADLTPIRSWPGAEDASFDYVPTALTYNSKGTLLHWGFGCKVPEVGEFVETNFYAILDPDHAGNDRSVDNEKRSLDFLSNFLFCVYQHIRRQIQTRVD